MSPRLTRVVIVSNLCAKLAPYARLSTIRAPIATFAINFAELSATSSNF